MTYKVRYAGHVICRREIMRTLPHIPETEQERIFVVESVEYQYIWRVYVKLRESQKTKPLHDEDPLKVWVREDAEHMDQFREALNIYMRFLAEGKRDTCNQVISIETVPDLVPAEA